MAKKIQIGFIGGGMIANAHMRNFHADRRTEIRALADVNENALQAMGAEYGIAHLTTNYKELLKDPELDAVVVCTPPGLHCQIGIDVLRAQKHLIMEKPLTRTPAEARRLLKEAQKHPDLMVTGCSCRHARLQPKYPYVKRLIDSGKIGDVYFVHHRAVSRQGRPGIEYHPTAKWFLDREMAGGGPLYDWGVYDLSFHLGVLGEPTFKRCEAFCVNGLDRVPAGTKTFTVEEHGGALLSFENGLKYFWERASNAHHEVPNQTSIYGTKGGLRFTYTSFGEVHEIEHFYTANSGKGAAKKRVYTVNMSRHDKGDMHPVGQAIIKALQGKGPVPMPFELEVKNLEILHAVYKAANWS
jgi:predicted dehydrogenase